MPTIGDCPKCEKRSFIIEDSDNVHRHALKINDTFAVT